MIRVKPQKGYLVALESVAMTDIVMNMFIFFFISFSLLYTFSPEKIAKIDIKLPRATTAVALEGAEKSILTVSRDGHYYVNEAKISRRDLKEALTRARRHNPSMALLLKVDGAARFDAMAYALDIINDLKITKVSVAAIKPKR